MYKYMMTIIILIFTPCAYDNIANSILMSRSSEEKTQILSDMVNAAGEPCTPTESFFQGLDKDEAAYWNIACFEGQAYVIQIANNNQATTTIFQCNAMKSLGAECFKRFGE